MKKRSERWNRNITVLLILLAGMVFLLFLISYHKKKKATSFHRIEEISLEDEEDSEKVDLFAIEKSLKQNASGENGETTWFQLPSEAERDLQSSETEETEKSDQTAENKETYGITNIGDYETDVSAKHFDRIEIDEETKPTEEETAKAGTALQEDPDAALRAQKEEEEVLRSAFEEAAKETQSAVRFTGYSELDYNVLLRIVEAEAGNCDLTGKILVANVVLNRVRSNSFPNTITQVVYQKGQFSPVSNGAIVRCQVTASTVEAVNRALHGEDLSMGALYFMNRKLSAKQNIAWFDQNLKFLFRYGEHEFFR